MKKRTVIEVICGILIFIVGMLAGDTNAINRINKSIDTKISSNNNQSNSTSKETTNNSVNKYERYKLNEIGKTGNYQLKTDQYKETNEIKTWSKTYTTANKFVIADIEIAANDKALEFGYSPNDFILADSEQKTYNVSDITNELNVGNQEKDNNYVGIFNPLNPNVFKKTQLVFEVPKDIKPLLLINKNEGSTTYVEFELH